MKANQMETLAGKRSMRGQFTAAENRLKTLKTQLADAQLAHEKLANKSFRAEANFGIRMITAE